MPLNYEQAKDQIANEAGYPNFLTALKDRMEPTNRYTVTELINKAAELYADSVAREAWDRAVDATLNALVNFDKQGIIKPEYQPK